MFTSLLCHLDWALFNELRSKPKAGITCLTAGCTFVTWAFQRSGNQSYYGHCHLTLYIEHMDMKSDLIEAQHHFYQ